MKPNRFNTPQEDAEIAKRFDNLHKRPNTDDWEFWDMLGEVDRLRDDGERRETIERKNGTGWRKQWKMGTRKSHPTTI